MGNVAMPGDETASVGSLSRILTFGATRRHTPQIETHRNLSLHEPLVEFTIAPGKRRPPKAVDWFVVLIRPIFH